MTRNEKPIETWTGLDPTLPLAVFLVGGDNDLGPASLLLSAAYTRLFHPGPLRLRRRDGLRVLRRGADPSRGFEGPEESGRLRERPGGSSTSSSPRPRLA